MSVDHADIHARIREIIQDNPGETVSGYQRLYLAKYGVGTGASTVKKILGQEQLREALKGGEDTPAEPESVTIPLSVLDDIGQIAAVVNSCGGADEAEPLVRMVERYGVQNFLTALRIVRRIEGNQGES